MCHLPKCSGLLLFFSVTPCHLHTGVSFRSYLESSQGGWNPTTATTEKWSPTKWFGLWFPAGRWNNGPQGYLDPCIMSICYHKHLWKGSYKCGKFEDHKLKIRKVSWREEDGRGVNGTHTNLLPGPIWKYNSIVEKPPRQMSGK